MTLQQKVKRLMVPYRQDAIAKAAGITPQTLRHVLLGNKKPTLVTIMGLAQALGVNVGWLIDDRKGWPPEREAVAAVNDLEQVHAA